MKINSLNFETLTPSQGEILAARNASRVLAEVMQGKELVVQIEGNKRKEVILPISISKALIALLSEVAEGNSIAMVPQQEELTTQEAANLLKISRPYFIKLLEKGEIPYRMIGKHRRVKLIEVIKYNEYMENQHLEGLDILASEAQKYDLGY